MFSTKKCRTGGFKIVDYARLASQGISHFYVFVNLEYIFQSKMFEQDKNDHYIFLSKKCNY